MNLLPIHCSFGGHVRFDRYEIYITITQYIILFNDFPTHILKKPKNLVRALKIWIWKLFLKNI